jgi:MFS family permease
MIILVVGLAAALFSHDFWWLCVTLFIAGFGVAPILSLLYSTISATVAFSETAEAFGWVATGQLIGAALGAAVAGVAIDRLGVSAGLGTSMAFTLVTLLIAILTAKRMPDLRNRSFASGH